MSYLGFPGGVPPTPCGVPPFPPVPITVDWRDRRRHHHHHRDDEDRRGPQGPPGPPGPPGPTLPNVSGSFGVSPFEVPAGTTTKIPLATPSFATGISISNNNLWFQNGGTYMVTFSVVVQTSMVTGTQVTVTPVGAIPGTPGIIGTEMVEGNSSYDISASFIIRASAGSTLGFNILSSASNINVTHGTVSAALIAQ